MMNGGFLDDSGKNTRTTEVGRNSSLELGFAARDVLTSFDGLTQVTIDSHPVGATEHGTRTEEGQWIVVSTSIIDSDIPQHVFADLLGEVDVDAQEVGISLGSLNLVQQALEPTEGRSITADPEEFDTTENTKVATLLSVPDVLEDRCKGGNTDTSSNQDGNFSIENILRRGTIRSINANLREGRSSGRVDLNKIATRNNTKICVLFTSFDSSLGHLGNSVRTDTKTVTQGASEVSNLTDVNGNIRILGSRGDGERMPLELGNLWYLEEHPLTRSIFEAWLDNTKLHRTAGVDEDFGQTSGLSGPNLTPYTFSKVQDAGVDDEPPAKVAKAVIGAVEREGRDDIRFDGIAHKASGSMSVDTNHEEESQVVGVPKCLKALLANLLMGSGVHENHDEEHEVTSNSTRLGVMNHLSSFLADLSTLDIDEVDVVGGSMNYTPESHRVSHLTMEPNVFISRECPSKPGTDDADDVAQHGKEDETSIVCKDEAGSTRDPYRPSQGIECGKLGIGSLTVPPIGKETEVRPIKEDVK